MSRQQSLSCATLRDGANFLRDQVNLMDVKEEEDLEAVLKATL